jgi:two-component system, OmpR family, sensor histidine kinase PhoQ
LNEHLARINQVVSYQLQRAVSSHQAGLYQRVAVGPLIERLIKTLDKVYAQKALDWQLSLSEPAVFTGDEQDLMEIAGNLLDNACKYGRKRIAISLTQTDEQLSVEISDDGPGIAVAYRDKILERGRRLDSLEPGQGIGLAITIDIVSSYGGSLDISQSALGGACFKLVLPITSSTSTTGWRR